MDTNKDALVALQCLSVHILPDNKLGQLYIETIRNALQTQAELVEALRDLKEFFAVGDEDMSFADDESLGWQGDKELPTTFGQIRRLKKALARAEGRG